eukprot:TRINITY_DN102879_c0_g1_i1.p1 TRINITY_DN102879_c0_g1~~TRINITY_DN102879_c0_g1_i1.p1  ORF type:complete len:754 (+),score=103.33 TRINITY_DN102879_c0_g1_i1:38-2263(+)
MAVSDTGEVESICHDLLNHAKKRDWNYVWETISVNSHIRQQLVDGRPAARRFALVHTAAWQLNFTVIKTLAEEYQASFSLLTKDGCCAADIWKDAVKQCPGKSDQEQQQDREGLEYIELRMTLEEDSGEQQAAEDATSSVVASEGDTAEIRLSRKLKDATCNSKKELTDSVEGVIRVFRAFDVDQDGVISREELMFLLEAVCKHSMTQDETDIIIQAADANEDGMIQYEEFVSWISEGSGVAADIAQIGESLSQTCPPGLNPCRYGATCFNKEPSHRKKFWHPVPEDYDKLSSMRRACKFGSGCYQKNAGHLSSFVHPGDRNYKDGQVIFGRRGPQFDTLWQLFFFFDPDDSGNLMKEEFDKTIAQIARLTGSTIADTETVWTEAAGDIADHLNFTQFVHIAQKYGVKLPLGTADLGASRPCHFKLMVKDGWSCTCAGYQQGPDGFLCECGHKPSLHRSEGGGDNSVVDFKALRWVEGVEGLVEIHDEAIHQSIQRLLDGTHKSPPNWTRDRGCKVHGRSHPDCNSACIRANGWPVPVGYRVKKVYRNQNPTLWKNYALTRSSITEECSGSSKHSSATYEDVQLISNFEVDGPLNKGCNEWFVLHGTKYEACQGICQNNFRLSLSGKGATWKDPGSDKGMPLYGYGIYLAERITKSDEYSTGEEDGLCSTVVARCVGGRVNVVTTNEIDRQKLRDDVFDGPYHSVLGDRVVSLGKPFREVVVYDKDQIFPEFLVRYERILG